MFERDWRRARLDKGKHLADHHERGHCQLSQSVRKRNGNRLEDELASVPPVSPSAKSRISKVLRQDAVLC